MSGYSSTATKIYQLYTMKLLNDERAVAFELAHFLGLMFAKYETFAA